MKQFLPLLSLVALVQGNAIAPSVEFINFKTPKIINGDNASPGEWKWQASLQYGSSGHICGASLVDVETVVTAAHCVSHDTNPDNYRVVLGEHSRNTNSGDEQTMRVASITMHRSYNDETIQNDIAVMKLTTSAVLSSHVQPIALPSSNADFSNAECWITGWGRTGSSSSLPNVLQELRVQTLTNTDCKKKNTVYGRYVTSGMICLVGNNAGDGGACNGDSGGPMACKVGNTWTLAGVTSWGMAGCPADINNPSVYTRVTSYVSWINSNSR